MPTFNTADDQARYALVPFDEAIAYLGGKINQDTDRWDDLATPQEHDAAFVVAGVKGALLQDIRAEVERALREGKSREDFKAEFRDIVRRRGWDGTGGNDWRAAIIYQTNLRQAYGDGRCRQMSDPDVISARPYRMWIHGDSRVPRPEHRAMNGKVFRADHPVAQTRLPSGFGCKCTWVSLSERDMQRRGLQVETGITWGTEIDTAKGRKPLTIDRGFGAPCRFESEQDREERKRSARKQILDRIPPNYQRDAIREIANFLNTIAGISILTGINLIPVPIGIIKEIADAAGLAKDIIATMPLGLYLPNAIAAETSKMIRGEIYRRVAEKVRQQIKQESVDDLILALKGAKDNPLTVIVGGAGDDDGESSVYLASRLKKQGLLGNVVVDANQIKISEERNIFPGMKLPGFIDNLFDAFDSSLQVYQQSLYLSEDSVKAIIGLALQNKVNKINLVAHSAGSAIIEDIAGVLNRLGIEVDNVVTLGGITTPPKLGANTKYRRYISDADEYQKVQKIANTGQTDRFYKGILHGNEDFLEEMGLRGILKTWLGNRKVLNDVVEDLNPPKFVPPTQKQIPFSQLPDVTQTVDVNPIQPPDVANLPKATPKPPLRIIKPDELEILRADAKKELPFKIRVNKNKNGTFNVEPGIRDEYVWTPEQASQVADFLKAKGVYLPDDFDPNNIGWREGANYLQVIESGGKLENPFKRIKDAIINKMTKVGYGDFADLPLDQFEDAIRDQDIEIAGVYDKVTDKQIVLRSTNTEDEVQFLESDLPKFKGNVVTHNHPIDKELLNYLGKGYKGESFSDADISLAVEYEAAEIRAVTEGWNHSMKPKGNNWDIDLDSLEQALEDSEQEALEYLAVMEDKKEALQKQFRENPNDRARLGAKLDQLSLTRARLEYEFNHYKMIRVARKINAKYTRKSR